MLLEIPKILIYWTLVSGQPLSAVSLLMGNVPLASLSALGGASIEIGKIALHVVTGLNEFRQFKDNHPLGYVFEARKLSRER
jgi:hypothetical protein